MHCTGLIKKAPEPIPNCLLDPILKDPNPKTRVVLGSDCFRVIGSHRHPNRPQKIRIYPSRYRLVQLCKSWPPFHWATTKVKNNSHRFRSLSLPFHDCRPNLYSLSPITQKLSLEEIRFLLLVAIHGEISSRINHFLCDLLLFSLQKIWI